MRAVVQRVSRASVSVDGEMIGSIKTGLCVLLGAMEGDSVSDADFLAAKLASLRIFPDAEEKMNLNVSQVEGAVLLVSQFTLAADTTSGARPSFTAALAPAQAELLFEHVAEALRSTGLKVETGRFGAKMLVEIHNDGPVTIIMDSQAKKRK